MVMSTNRIDHLRHLVAQLGERQRDFYRFFPDFADRLVAGLGSYLGDLNAVALTCAYDEFDFDSEYRHAGLDIEAGRFRIPIMVKLKNLNDNGYLACRLRLYCGKEKDVITAQIDGHPSVQVTDPDLEPLYEYIYEVLGKMFSDSTWFASNSPDYQGSAIGFHAGSAK